MSLALLVALFLGLRPRTVQGEGELDISTPFLSSCCTGILPEPPPSQQRCTPYSNYCGKAGIPPLPYFGHSISPHKLEKYLWHSLHGELLTTVAGSATW